MTSLESIRKKIDEIDTAMLALVALRMEQSKLIKAHKHGQPIQDAARELHLQKKWNAQAQVLGIEPTLALEMLDLLLTESRNLQADTD